MAKFAVGKHAYGICDRSGFRYKLNEMRKEWNGSLVGRDMWEAKHPQLEPRRKVSDAQALRQPRPDVAEGPTAQLLPANPIYIAATRSFFSGTYSLQITVTHPGHGREVGDRVYFTNTQGFNDLSSSYINRENGFGVDLILTSDSYRITEPWNGPLNSDQPTRGGGTLVTVRT